MALTARNYFWRVTVNGDVVGTAGTPTINESIQAMTRVAEFSLASQPESTPSIGQTVQIDFCNVGSDIFWPAFAGTIDAIEVESQPWEMVVRCTGPLALLRKVRTGSDYNLTGKTDGEVIEDILTYCGISYSPSDILDMGYEFGERQAVKWLIDVPASQILREIDTVLGCVTLEIGAGRVVRFNWDPAPENGLKAVRTYERAVDYDFFQNHRSRGNRDQIQNVWEVHGPTVRINDNCNATVWAKAADSNPQLGRKVRVQTGTFQSDLIQDEALAEYVVKRLMWQSNKTPDMGSIEVFNHPNISPGSVVTLEDDSYGINAAPRHFSVQSVDRSGFTMVLGLVAGPRGDEGTVTTGVEKVCNDTHSNQDWPGTFTPPGGFTYPGFDFDTPSDSFSFPPFPEFSPWFFSDGPGGGPSGDDPPDSGGADAVDLLAPVWIPFWQVDNDIWGPGEAGSWVFDGSTGEASIASCDGSHAAWGTQATLRVTGAPADTANWTLTLDGSTTIPASMLWLQLTDDEGGAGYVQDVTLKFAAGPDQVSEFILPDDSDLAGVALSDSTSFRMKVVKTGDDFTASLEQPVGSVIYSHTINDGWTALATAEDMLLSMVAYSDGLSNGDCVSGGFSITALSLELGIAEEQWESEFGTWDIDGSNLTESSGFGHAYYIGPGAGGDRTISGWNTITFEADVDQGANGSNDEYFAILLQDNDDIFAGYEILGPDFNGDWTSDLFDFESGDYTDTRTGDTITSPFHLQVTFNNALGNMSSDRDGATLSGVLGSYSAPVRLMISAEAGATVELTNVVVTVA